MAKEYAKSFYRSKEWQNVRRFVLMRDHFMCVRCGQPAEEIHHIIHITPDNIMDPKITLNPDNLQSLCHECHLHEHVADSHPNTKKITGDFPEYSFDENGYLVER